MFMVQRCDGRNAEDSSEMWSDTLWIANYDGDATKGLEVAIKSLEHAREKYPKYNYRLIQILEI